VADWADHLGRRADGHAAQIALDDNAVLALEFGGRALGYIEVGWTSGPGLCGFEIYGDNGTIINDYEQGLRICTGKVTPDLNAALAFTWNVEDEKPATGGWVVEVDHFVETVLAGGTFTMGLDAGASALGVALAAIKSAKDGQRQGLLPVS